MVRLEEVKKLQKIAGILKENINENPSVDMASKVAQVISQLEPQEDEYENWVDYKDEMATNTKMYMFNKTAKIPGYKAVVVGDTSDGKQAYWLLTRDMESDDPYGYPSGILPLEKTNNPLDEQGGIIPLKKSEKKYDEIEKSWLKSNGNMSIEAIENLKAKYFTPEELEDLFQDKRDEIEDGMPGKDFFDVFFAGDAIDIDDKEEELEDY